MQALTRLRPFILLLAILGSACGRSDHAELVRLTLRVDSLAKAITVLGQQAGLSNRAAAAPQVVRTSLEAGLRSGPRDSRFVLLEFTDYYCPYCATFTVSTLGDIRSKAPDLEYVVRNYPIPEIHPKAAILAAVVECVADADTSVAWAVHRRLFYHQAEVRSLGLTRIDSLFDPVPAPLRGCLRADARHSRVDRDRAEAAHLKLRGTPALILGRSIAGDSIEGMVLQGAYPAAEVAEIAGQPPQRGRVVRLWCPPALACQRRRGYDCLAKASRPRSHRGRDRGMCRCGRREADRRHARSADPAFPVQFRGVPQLELRVGDSARTTRRCGGRAAPTSPRIRRSRGMSAPPAADPPTATSILHAARATSDRTRDSQQTTASMRTLPTSATMGPTRAIRTIRSGVPVVGQSMSSQNATQPLRSTS